MGAWLQPDSTPESRPPAKIRLPPWSSLGPPQQGAHARQQLRKEEGLPRWSILDPLRDLLEPYLSSADRPDLAAALAEEIGVAVLHAVLSEQRVVPLWG